MKKYALCEYDNYSDKDLEQLIIHKEFSTLEEAQQAQYQMCGRIYGLTQLYFLSEYNGEASSIKEDRDLIDETLNWGDGHAVE